MKYCNLEVFTFLVSNNTNWLIWTVFDDIFFLGTFVGQDCQNFLDNSVEYKGPWMGSICVDVPHASWWHIHVFDLLTFKINPVEFELLGWLVGESNGDTLLAMDWFQAWRLVVVKQLQPILNIVLLGWNVDLTTETISKIKNSILVWLALHSDNGHNLTWVA